MLLIQSLLLPQHLILGESTRRCLCSIKTEKPRTISGALIRFTISLEPLILSVGHHRGRGNGEDVEANDELNKSGGHFSILVWRGTFSPSMFRP